MRKANRSQAAVQSMLDDEQVIRASLGSDLSALRLCSQRHDLMIARPSPLASGVLIHAL